MRFHCLGGAGAIGSLVSTNLATLPQTQVRIIVRRADQLKQLLKSGQGTSTSSSEQHGHLTIETDGVTNKSPPLELERMPSPNIREATISASFVRNDPIDSLIITTKAQHTLPALPSLIPRLSSRSTIMLLQNGMGTYESILEKYWPNDHSESEPETGRPNFIIGTTTHGVWRKGPNWFVHAGQGEIRFGVIPNKLTLSTLEPSSPLRNPLSLQDPTLGDFEKSESNRTLYSTIDSLLRLPELQASWLPRPTLQIAQLQKLAVNASVNTLTALLGSNNGTLSMSDYSTSIIRSISSECSTVFAAHLSATIPEYTSSPSNSSESESVLDSKGQFRPEHPLSTESLLEHTLAVVKATHGNTSSTLSDLLKLYPSTYHPSTPPFARIPKRSSPSSSSSSPTLTELEYINGYITRLGKKYNVETKLTGMMALLVLMKEDFIKKGIRDVHTNQVLEASRKGLEIGKNTRRRLYDPNARDDKSEEGKGEGKGDEEWKGKKKDKFWRYRASETIRQRNEARKAARTREFAPR